MMNAHARVQGLVLSCDSAVCMQRRKAIRHWWPRAVALIFAVGRAALQIPELHKDVLWLPCSDSYEHLPAKVLESLQWLISHRDFDFILKVDDDTFACVDQIKAQLSDAPRGRLVYAGRLRQEGPMRVHQSGRWQVSFPFNHVRIRALARCFS